ncbi:DnaD domain protein [Halobacillus massiliensis]|uniref:DnaD domain protein n=1 Tax=Halobacillus massiliensis TaxID=1926286 RepID=UPI0009E28958|nr:DnaD domain protein [Halobacillus massiliensis]
MNYIKEMNAFHDELELNGVSSSAQVLWYLLMQFNNKTGWKQEFSVPTAAILVKSGLPESTFLRARRELEEKGYIHFQGGSRTKTPAYEMISQVKESQAAEEPKDRVKEEAMDENKDSAEDLFKRKERKRKENVGGSRQPHTFYEQNLGMITPFMAEKITDWCERLSDEVVIESMRIAVEHNKLFFSYCEGILKRWENQQVKTLADVKRVEAKPERKSRKKDDRAIKLKAMVDEFRKERRI